MNADGSADNSFTSPTINGNPSGNLTDFALLDDGSIVISGTFFAVNGITKDKIARLRSDGSLDSVSFPTGTDGTPTVLLKRTDGKLLTGGGFTIIEKTPRTGLAAAFIYAVVHGETLRL